MVGPVLSLAAAASVAVASVSPPRFHPAFTSDFADPFVLPWGGGYLGYATNAKNFEANVQMAASRDLVHWQSLKDGHHLHDALPDLPEWAIPGRTWAPEVLPVGDHYVLYFAAAERRSGLQCVGVAVSGQDPRGPFKPVGEKPLVCQRDLGGTIDPAPFRDRNGRLYLLYKSDGNNPKYLKPSAIYIQRLRSDGLTLTGKPIQLIHNDRHWEWRVVELPGMVRDPQGRYVLLYSGNHFGWGSDQLTSNYAVGYARCRTVMGPCVKGPENPILKSGEYPGGGCLSGPGHQTVFEDAGRSYVVFHAWAATRDCHRAEKSRFMYLGALDWRNGTPVIEPVKAR